MKEGDNMITENYNIEESKGKTALLINPPVYDFAYSNHYNQPDGLLRVATLLKNKGYRTNLLDFLAREGWRGISATPQKREKGKGKGLTRYHYGFSFKEFEKRLRKLPFYPDEVYVTSIMTYWWESTRDVISMVRKMYPKSTILVGGVYPTLCPEHANINTGADIVIKGEIEEASNLWTDLSLYRKSPSYAIINISRGCPFRCAYCAQDKLNGAGMRFREPEDVVAEIENKYRSGVSTFWIFSDNFLIGNHFHEILDLIVAKGLKITISAPKGMEPRLITNDLLKLMKRAGWKTINMAFETANSTVREKSWNRRHNTNTDFERAVRLCGEQGFKTGSGGIVGFLLFGAPGERIADVRNTMSSLHGAGVFIRPMPFTPVPGTEIFEQYKDYIIKEGLSLEDLNEKLFPFEGLNGISIQEYMDLQKEMYQLNTKLNRHIRVNPIGAADLLNFKIHMAYLNLGQTLACPV